MISGFAHFSFTVADIEQSIAWYRDVLGLELVARQRQENEYTRSLVGLPDAVLEVAEFSLPGGPPEHGILLELIEYVEPRGERLARGTQDVGTAHVSFVVENIDSEYARLSRARTSFVSPPLLISSGANTGGRICYLQDPDGITLELFQPADNHT